MDWMEGGGQREGRWSESESRREKTRSLVFRSSAGEFVCYCKDWYTSVLRHLLWVQDEGVSP